MPSFSSDYVLLKEKLLITICSRSSELSLDNVKNEYRGVINSTRLLSSINDFVQLLCVLEKRGHIGEYLAQIAALRSLASKVNDAELNAHMSQYEENLRGNRRAYENLYALNLGSSSTSVRGLDSLSSAASMQSRPNSNPTVSNYLSKSDKKDENTQKYNEAVDLVCCAIGKQWTELARQLSLREGEIDSINIKHPNDLKARAREALALFARKTDPEKWQQKLLEGLVQARRRDLKDEVEELLLRRTH